MTERQAEKPRTIPEAVKALHTLLPASQLEVVKASSANDLIRFHFNLGAYIRNLWVHEASPLSARVTAVGGRIGDGDDLSRLIIEALWNDLNQRTFDVTKSQAFLSLLPSAESAAQLAAALMLNE